MTFYIYLGAAGILGFIMYAAFRHGEKMEKLSNLETDIKAAEDAKKVQNEVDRLPADTVTGRLSKWRR